MRSRMVLHAGRKRKGAKPRIIHAHCSVGQDRPRLDKRRAVEVGCAARRASPAAPPRVADERAEVIPHLALRRSGKLPAPTGGGDVIRSMLTSAHSSPPPRRGPAPFIRRLRGFSFTSEQVIEARPMNEPSPPEKPPRRFGAALPTVRQIRDRVRRLSRAEDWKYGAPSLLVVLIAQAWRYFASYRVDGGLFGDGYYSWIFVRSIAFDGDVHFANDYAVCGDPWHLGIEEGGHRPANPFYFGPAIFLSPVLFILRHLIRLPLRRRIPGEPDALARWSSTRESRVSSRPRSSSSSPTGRPAASTARPRALSPLSLSDSPRRSMCVGWPFGSIRISGPLSRLRLRSFSPSASGRSHPGSAPPWRGPRAALLRWSARLRSSAP